MISALPQVAFLALDGKQGVYFLAGKTGNSRATRYMYPQPHGSLHDFWLGVPAIVGTPALCQTLFLHPNSWILVDEARLTVSWGFSDSMATVLRGAGIVKFTGMRSTYAIKVKSVTEWKSTVAAVCQSALRIAPPPDPSSK